MMISFVPSHWTTRPGNRASLPSKVISPSAPVKPSPAMSASPCWMPARSQPALIALASQYVPSYASAA